MKCLRSIRSFCLALVPLLFVLTACDSGGSNTEIDNQFSLTISSSSSSTAAVSKKTKKDLSGYSFFVDAEDVDDVDDDAFVIYLSGNESFSEQNATEGLFGFMARNSGQPGTGEYSITDDPSSSEFGAWLYEDLTDRESGAPYYFIHNGSLSLSTSTDRKVAGSISGRATEYAFTSTGVSLDTVDVSGSFTAKRLDTYVSYSNYADPSGQ
jgi:hypothetical protein